MKKKNDVFVYGLITFIFVILFKLLKIFEARVFKNFQDTDLMNYKKFEKQKKDDNMDSFELKGSWWLPDQQEKQYFGTLTFNPQNGGILDLNHGSDDLRRIRKTFHSNIPIICGLADNKEITLRNCTPTIRRLFGDYTTYKVDVIIQGEHFVNIESIKLKDLFFQISCLRNWLNKDAYTSNIDSIFEYPQKKAEIIIKSLPVNIGKAIINNDIVIELINTFDFKEFNDKQIIDKQPYFKIKCKKERTYNEIEVIINHFRDFLSIATSKPLYIKKLKSRLNSNNYDIEYFFRRKFGSADLLEDLHPLNMIFNYTDIEKSMGFQKAVQNWFYDFKELRHIYRLFTLTQYSNDVLQSKFLSLSQALDSYTSYYIDSKKANNKDINKFVASSEFKRRKRVILSSLPISESKEIFSNWLNNSLQNHAKFSQKLELLCFNELADIFGSCDVKQLIKYIVSVRNALSHGHNDSLQEENKYLANISDFVWLYYGQKMLLTATLLNKIGFNNEEIKTQLKRYFRYKDIIEGKYLFE